MNYSKQAIKFLKKQDKSTQRRIVTAIQALPAGDVKKLQGMSGYRLRVGDYRVRFDREGNVVSILKIDNRGQVYNH
ncbi:MAG: type II toxin-antitoxin system RelE/ParE family toxin [Lachnospiraceae bacterium]|nr:type II toxin-antitoxin system RelE/ParE family toxin [Lachnospiraceae bacterium]